MQHLERVFGWGRRGRYVRWTFMKERIESMSSFSARIRWNCKNKMQKLNWILFLFLNYRWQHTFEIILLPCFPENKTCFQYLSVSLFFKIINISDIILTLKMHTVIIKTRKISVRAPKRFISSRRKPDLFYVESVLKEKKV